MSTLTLSLSNLHMSMSHLPSPPLSPVSCASTSSASHSHPSMSMSMDHSGHSSQSVSHASTPGFRSRNLSPYSSFHMCEVDTHTTCASTSTCYASSSSSSSSPLPAPAPIIDVDSDEAVEVGSPQHAAHVIAAANAKASARRLSLDRKQSPLLSFLPSPSPPSPMNETKVLTPTSPLKHVTLKSVPITPSHSSSRSSLSSQYPTLHPRYIVTDNKHVPVIQTSLYGTVIRAWDTLCQCPVAIKISSRSLLSIHLSTEGEPILEDVRNECLHMTHLHGEMPTQHVFDAQRWHHVVPLLDQRQDSQYHYLVTPFYNGSDLFTYLTSQPNCRLANDDHIHYLFTQLIDATQHLHSHGLAHRDITLENVLLHVNDEGTHVDLHLIDLGVAVSKPSNSEDDDMHFSCTPLPENALKPGKIEYMSPELLSHEPWDAFANDVFSLGTILYQMAVGQPPFDAADDACADYILSGTWKRHLRPLYRLETPPCMEYAYDEEWTPRHDHIDPYLLDLITHLLCPQSQRYTIQQIQQHVWVRGED